MNKERLREIYKKYELTADDVFVQNLSGREIPTIKREGIEKIQAKLGIVLRYELCHVSEDNSCVIIKCTGQGHSGAAVESYGEATPKNTKQSYPVAMAEKRAKARVVLQIAGLYQEGVYSEDELK